MSRVDDDRDAARLAQRLAQQKQQEQKRTDAKASESAFARLMQDQKKAEGDKPKPQRAAEGAPQTPSTGKKDDPRRPAPQPSKFGAKLSQGEMAQQLKQTSQQGQEIDSRGRNTDRASGRSTSESRKGDAATTDRTLKERSSEGEQSGVSSLEGARGEKGPIRIEGDKGKGSGGGDKDGKDGSQGAQPGFRFNPALMAPVPVAAPKDTAKLEKLRKLAEEIAQKIVERARVGTNAAGQAEMQIDLRSSVLAGLSMKISCSNGRIRATFAGSDREVMKMLRENEGALRSTLEGKGLRLEEFKVEERA